VPRYKIYGSEELSARSPGIAELVTPGFVEIRSEDAASLGVADGDGVIVGGLITLEVRVNDRIAPGCLGFAAGHSGTGDLAAGMAVTLEKSGDWTRNSPQLIGSDKGGA
jgi:NADH-quinone oxidoreductase subunit G